MRSKQHGSEPLLNDSDPVIADNVLTHLFALKDHRSDVRAHAADMLGQIGDPAAVPALIEALKDYNLYTQEVRKKAAEALGKIGDSRAIPALVEALTGAVSTLIGTFNSYDSEAEAVRQAVAWALARMGREAVLPLVAIFKGSNSEVRYHALRVLVKIGDRAAVPALIEALNDHNAEVRLMGARALVRMGDASAVPMLLHVLGDNNAAVRAAAAKALHRIGTLQTLPLRVISNGVLTPVEKLDALESLRRLYREDSLFYTDRLPLAGVYCQKLLKRDRVEAGVRAGAEAVLAEIERRSDPQTLLRATPQIASQSNNAKPDGTDLLRAASTDPTSFDPAEHLRPSEPSPEEEQHPSTLKRWFENVKAKSRFGLSRSQAYQDGRPHHEADIR